mgnify:CR=1 FL=1|jgi:hypothetical protein
MAEINKGGGKEVSSEALADTTRALASTLDALPELQAKEVK